MALPTEIPDEFNDITDREILIAVNFALEVLKGVAWFPKPVGDTSGMYTDEQNKWIAHGYDCAWNDVGVELVLPLYGDHMNDTRRLATTDYEAREKP